MAQVTRTEAQNNKAWQWLVNGWHALRDKAVSAVTYFAPADDRQEDDQRWGVLAADISEGKNSLHVELELPGMEKADLSVQVQDHQLVVSGEKRVSDTRREGSIVVTERAFGRFQRTIALPCEVESEGTRASYKNGVLSIDLPKDRSRHPKAIPITQG